MKVSDAKLVEAVISGRSRAEIALALKVTERQVYRRLAKPDVRAAIDKAGRELARLARWSIQREQERSVQVLAEIRDDVAVPPRDRVAAAKALIDRESRSEVDELATLLEDLEGKAGRGAPPSWRNTQ